jgi:hypothetical protein
MFQSLFGAGLQRRVKLIRASLVMGLVLTTSCSPVVHQTTMDMKTAANVIRRHLLANYHPGGHSKFLIPVMHGNFGHVAFMAAHPTEHILKGACFQHLNGKVFTEEEPWYCDYCDMPIDWSREGLWLDYTSAD